MHHLTKVQQWAGSGFGEVVGPREGRDPVHTGDGEGSTGVAQLEVLLTPAEVADMFGVGAKTVTRWAQAGKLSAVRTLGGHRRYRAAEVRALRAGEIPAPRTPSAGS